jgi:hypothetical protein
VLRERVWAHFERGGEGKPMAADKPGDVNSGMLILISGTLVQGDGMGLMMNRSQRRGVPDEILCERLCGE